MPTLVIHAPKSKARSGLHSFQHYFATGVGKGYIIPPKGVARLHRGCTVVLLDKEQKLRAEGSLVRLVPTAKTPTGKQRYDVHFARQRKVPYRPEKLDRCGTAVLDC